MHVTLQEIVHDLITRPGLGMFAWFCLITFFMALVFFVWALKSGQMSDLEQSKFDMLEDNPKKRNNVEKIASEGYSGEEYPERRKGGGKITFDP